MSRTLMLLVLSAPLIVFSRLSFAQNDGRIHIAPLAEQSQGMSTPPVTNGDEASAQALQSYRKQRQQELLRDAAKLHELSGELQAFLDKNGSTVLSIDMLKKAETMEKLAKSVRSKMKELQ